MHELRREISCTSVMYDRWLVQVVVSRELKTVTLDTKIVVRETGGTHETPGEEGGRRRDRQNQLLHPTLPDTHHVVGPRLFSPYSTVTYPRSTCSFSLSFFQFIHNKRGIVTLHDMNYEEPYLSHKTLDRANMYLQIQESLNAKNSVLKKKVSMREIMCRKEYVKIIAILLDFLKVIFLRQLMF